MSKFSVGYNRPVYVGIEGVYGVGKSTLLNALATASNVAVVPEWSSLANHGRRADAAPLPPSSVEEARQGIDFFFSLESERVRALGMTGADAIVADRSPFSVIAVEMALERLGFPADIAYAWEAYKRSLKERESFPFDAFIFLTCDSEELFRSRIAHKQNLHPFLSRWDVAEAVQRAYIDAFKKIPSDSVLHVSSAESFDDVLSATTGFMSVVSFVHREQMLLTSIFGDKPNR